MKKSLILICLLFLVSISFVDAEKITFTLLKGDSMPVETPKGWTDVYLKEILYDSIIVEQGPKTKTIPLGVTDMVYGVDVRIKLIEISPTKDYVVFEIIDADKLLESSLLLQKEGEWYSKGETIKGVTIIEMKEAEKECVLEYKGEKYNFKNVIRQRSGILVDSEKYTVLVIDVNENACKIKIIENLPECSDSDGGSDYYTKGKLTYYKHPENLADQYDICSSEDPNLLIERVCYSQTDPNQNYEVHRCEKGCQDGVCIKGEPQCVDSDGGKDYYTKGELTYLFHPQGLANQADICVTEGDPNYLIERVCNSQTNPDQNYERYYCEAGCKDGACLGKETTGESEGLIITEQESTKISCNGCLYQNECLPYGTRMEGKYCSIIKQFLPQKELNRQCENDYECKSNECSNNKCISTYGLLEKIWNWISNLFLIDKNSEDLLKKCETDSDCIIVSDGCCGCNAGGKVTTINNESLEDWRNKHLEDCEGAMCMMSISDHWTCKVKPKCINNKCILQEPK